MGCQTCCDSQIHACVMSLATQSSVGRCSWGGKGSEGILNGAIQPSPKLPPKHSTSKISIFSMQITSTQATSNLSFPTQVPPSSTSCVNIQSASCVTNISAAIFLVFPDSHKFSLLMVRFVQCGRAQLTNLPNL